MRRRDDKLALVALRKLLGEALDVLGVEQHALDDGDELLAGLGHAEETLAAADEQLHAKLVLEVLDVLAHARLRRVERVGDLS